MELHCQRKGEDDVLVKVYTHREIFKCIEGFRITNSVDFKQNTCCSFQRPCDPLSSQEEEKKKKKVNPGKMLQKIFELTYSKSVLFIVLLRFLTLSKDKLF